MKVPESIVKKNTAQLFFYLVELVDNNNCPERIRCQGEYNSQNLILKALKNGMRIILRGKLGWVRLGQLAPGTVRNGCPAGAAGNGS